MAQVLLVDTNFSSGPIYEELLSMDHEVHVVGNKPDDYLAKVSPNYWNLNYADNDALETLVNENQFDYLVPGCNDLSYTSCVTISNGRFPGLDKVDACEAIFNKGRFRQLADRLGIPVPNKLATDQRPNRWPIIVKPVDSYSGKGITVLRNKDPEKLANAVEAARQLSRTGEYLIEQFVEGQLHSHTAFLKDGQVIQDFLVQEDSTVNPFVVDTSRVVPNPSPNLLPQLRNCIQRLAKELALVDGLLHSQFMSKGEEFWLIETTRRCPGDLYSQLIELTTGYPYARSYVRPFLGESIQQSGGELRDAPIMRHTVTVSAAQNFAHLKFKSALQIEQWTPLSVAGDQLRPSPHSRVGILFCRATDQQDLEVIYQKTIQRNLYEVHA